MLSGIGRDDDGQWQRIENQNYTETETEKRSLEILQYVIGRLNCFGHTRTRTQTHIPFHTKSFYFRITLNFPSRPNCVRYISIIISDNYKHNTPTRSVNLALNSVRHCLSPKFCFKKHLFTFYLVA